MVLLNTFRRDQIQVVPTCFRVGPRTVSPLKGRPDRSLASTPTALGRADIPAEWGVRTDHGDGKRIRKG